MTINYDAEPLTGWRGLPRLFLRYRGTVLASTFNGPMFWLPNLLHVTMCFLGGQLWISPNAAVVSSAGSAELFDANGEFVGIDWTMTNLKVCARPASSTQTPEEL